MPLELAMLPLTEDRTPTRGKAFASKDASGRRRKAWLVLTIAFAGVAAVLFWGIWSRVRDARTIHAEAAQSAVTPVSVISPKQAAPAQEIILPGNVQPFSSSPIYSRTNGYLRKWYVDIGTRVKQGQLLAVIDAPEVDQQVEQSISNLNTAKANLSLAEITKTRYQGLLTKHAVSQQDVDNAVGTYDANAAIVEADQANVRQLQALQSFEKIYAPFDGVVTARNTDIGDLVNSGSAGGVKTDLFHIAQPGILRVYVNVPEEFSQGIKDGMIADISLAEFPDRKFQGKLVRTADAINMTTRTLLIEVDVDNPTGTLLTGSYAEVHLAIPTRQSTFVIPVNTLIFRSEGLRVAVVKDGKVVLVPVTPGHDFGNTIEIVAGLNAGDHVIVNPPDSIVSGQEVRIVQASLPGDTK
jgi:RND family efflux transporter MFP subunit